MRFIKTTVQFLVGFCLFSLGVACALRCAKELGSLQPEVAGGIVADILVIGLGMVGFRMLTSLLRREKGAH